MICVKVSESVNGIHCWKDSPKRTYLVTPHAHTFRVTIWAEVGHSDREIELHDLRDKLFRVLRSDIDVGLAENHEFNSNLNFGGMSCEDIGLCILDAMPEVYKVEVMEDNDCGAEVTRDKDVCVKKDKSDEKPRVITICGSTKFKDECLKAMQSFEEEGVAVFSVGSFMHKDGIPYDPGMKKKLDDLHLQKIKMSDAIFVLNVGGYIGESTRREIKYAISLGKEIQYLEQHR